MSNAVQAADLLIAARRDGGKIASLAENEPTNLEEAYAIQEAIITRIDLPVVGWKVALTNEEAMRRANAKEPSAGPLYAPYVWPSPFVIEKHTDSVAGFECEFVFRLAKDLPASKVPYTAETVIPAIASLHPAIEIVGLRLANRASLGVRGSVADHAGNFGVCYGAAVPDWRSVDLPAAKVRHLVDGEEIAASDGANVLGNPLNALAWLANHLAGRRRELKAGQWITTGAATGPLPAPRGSLVTGDFGKLGTVEVRFPGG